MSANDLAAQAKAQQDAIQANAAASMALFHTGAIMRKNLGVFPLTLGQKTRVKLENIGILTSVDFVVTCQLNITAPLTVSATGAEAILPTVVLNDYDGTSRVQVSARQLRMLNSLKARQLIEGFYSEFDADTGANNASPIGRALLRQVPTANGATQPFRFSGRIPVAYDPNSDLRGAIVMQTIYGECYCEFTPAAAFVGADADSVYTAGAAAVVAGTFNVQVFQNYIMPQKVGGVLPIPQQDVVTVYELAGTLKSSSNLAVNQDDKFPYPNVRQVMSAIFTYVNGGALNYGTDIAKIILQANSNTNLLEDDGLSILDRQRRILGCDGLGGTYYFDSRRVPVDTQLYGNVQAILTPNNVSAGNTYVEYLFESFYLKGQQLPGVKVG